MMECRHLTASLMQRLHIFSITSAAAAAASSLQTGVQPQELLLSIQQTNGLDSKAAAYSWVTT
jgi:hypothetical protein